MRSRVRRALLWLGLLGLLQAGCGGAPASAPLADDEAKLRGLVMLYSMAAGSLGRPPKTREELLAQLPPGSAGDADGLLRSSRDGDYYVVVWNLDLAGRHRSYAGPVAYERQGKDGKRWCVDAQRLVQEVDEATLRQLPFPPGYQREGL